MLVRVTKFKLIGGCGGCLFQDMRSCAKLGWCAERVTRTQERERERERESEREGERARERENGSDKESDRERESERARERERERGKEGERNSVVSSRNQRHLTEAVESPTRRVPLSM